MPASWHRALMQEPARAVRPVWTVREFEQSEGVRITKEGAGQTIIITGSALRAENYALAFRIAGELNGNTARTCPTCNTTWYPGDFR